MGKEAACIKYEGLARGNIDSGVCIPEVTMNKRRLHFAALTLKRIEKSWNNLVKKNRDKNVELFAWAFSFNLEAQRSSQAFGKECLPTIFPSHILWQITGISRDMEAEFPSRRLAFLVHSCEKSSELVGLRHVSCHFPKLAYEEMSVGLRFACAPSYRLGYKTW